MLNSNMIFMLNIKYNKYCISILYVNKYIMSIYEIKKYTYLNKLNDQYIECISINDKPVGELEHYVKKINENRLSPYEINKRECVYVMCDPINRQEILQYKDIIKFFNLLQKYNYSINNELTKMVQKSSSKNNDIICYIHYN